MSRCTRAPIMVTFKLEVCWLSHIRIHPFYSQIFCDRSDDSTNIALWGLHSALMKSFFWLSTDLVLGNLDDTISCLWWHFVVSDTLRLKIWFLACRNGLKFYLRAVIYSQLNTLIMIKQGVRITTPSGCMIHELQYRHAFEKHMMISQDLEFSGQFRA